ncbi:FHA domain-containing protein [Candidatus Micrarchaeota archaeon]|nr:FHA domain-containing protein [Candidatus Micrarchaeota archaeon]
MTTRHAGQVTTQRTIERLMAERCNEYDRRLAYLRQAHLGLQSAVARMEEKAGSGSSFHLQVLTPSAVGEPVLFPVRGNVLLARYPQSSDPYVFTDLDPSYLDQVLEPVGVDSRYASLLSHPHLRAGLYTAEHVLSCQSPKISRLHAFLERTHSELGGELRLHSLGGNPAAVNGQLLPLPSTPLRDGMSLHDGDRVDLGGVLEFKVHQPPLYTKILAVATDPFAIAQEMWSRGVNLLKHLFSLAVPHTEFASFIGESVAPGPVCITLDGFQSIHPNALLVVALFVRTTTSGLSFSDGVHLDSTIIRNALERIPCKTILIVGSPDARAWIPNPTAHTLILSPSESTDSIEERFFGDLADFIRDNIQPGQPVAFDLIRMQHKHSTDSMIVLG